MRWTIYIYLFLKELRHFPTKNSGQLGQILFDFAQDFVELVGTRGDGSIFKALK